MAKTFIVHFFNGAPCRDNHEAHEYSEAEMDEIFAGRLIHLKKDGLDRFVISIIDVMSPADTVEGYDGDGNRLVFHRIN